MHRTLGLTLLAALSTGCSADGKNDNTDFIQPGTSSDTESSDTALPDTTPTDDGVCPSWLGFTSADVAWEYTLLPPELADITYTVTLDSFVDSAGVLLETLSYTDDDGLTEYQLTASSFYCDDDGYHVTDRRTIVTTDPTDDDATYAWEEIVYNEPLLELARGIAVGDSWSVLVDGTASTHTGETTAFTLDVTYIVDSEELLSVPAGDYDTLRIETVTVEDPYFTVYNTFWYTWDVGLIASGLTELNSHTP